MNNITYTNKVAMNENASIPDINKVKADDMNEIKSVVNGNAQTSSNNFGTQTNTWNSSGTYAVGDIVVYNGNTYKNLTGTNTSSTPNQDTTNWENIPLITNESNNSTKNTYSSNYLNNNFGKKGKVLWTNSDPTSDFEGNATLNSTDYDYIDIICLTYPLRNTFIIARLYKEYKHGEIGCVFNYHGKMYGGSRYVVISNDYTKVNFETCFGHLLTPSASDVSGFDNWLIPQKIIGYK